MGIVELQSGVLVWEIRVVGWDVSYGAEFVPSAEDQYTIIIQKTRKITPADEPVITNSYKIGDPGKVVLTIDNQSSKKKKILYRTKTKTSSEWKKGNWTMKTRKQLWTNYCLCWIFTVSIWYKDIRLQNKKGSLLFLSTGLIFLFLSFFLLVEI